MGSTRWFCGAAFDGWSSDIQNHVFDSELAVFHVSSLVSVLLPMNHDTAIFCESIFVSGEKSLPHGFREGKSFSHIPAHNGLGTHFVHVLSALAAGASRGDFYIRFGDFDVDGIIDFWGDV